MDKVKIVLQKLFSGIKGIILAASQLLGASSKLKKIIVWILVILIGLGAISTLFKLISKGNSGNKINVAAPKKTLELNKDFSFPLKDSTGKTVSAVKYTIQTASLTDEFVVKGQVARSVKGRTFLILDIKIVNDFDKDIQVQSADYVRLSVNGNKTSWAAADAHNDPVTVAAISTKQVKLGFAINENDHDLLLRVGEINGEKTELPINFK